MSKFIQNKLKTINFGDTYYENIFDDESNDTYSI